MNDLILKASDFEEISNRLKKRIKHVTKWAKGQAIEYFRVFDRDCPGAPVIIDSLKQYWLIWICDNQWEPSQEARFISWLKQELNKLESKEVIVKKRKTKTKLDQRFNQEDKIVTIKENGLSFKLNLTRYLDTGLFIDHRKTRAFIRQSSKGKRVLNLFSYTGSFSCYALSGGANFVTSVDLNPQYSKWHEENCRLNEFNTKCYEILTTDVMAFLKKQHSKYDIIICDPPSFSQSKRKGAQRFQVQNDAHSLIKYCFNNLKKDGWILFSNNYRKFDVKSLGNDWDIKELTAQFCPKDFEQKWSSRCWRIKNQEQ